MEIKFRQWSSDRFHYWGCNADNFTSPLSNRLDIPSEQFTGLHDKNGKEIYEGDILQNEAGGHSPVVYRYGGFFVELVDCEEFGTMYVPLNEAILFAEIIGNIHENLELLESPC